MLTILGWPPSLNVRKVLWTCRELALDFTFEDLSGQDRDVRRDYLLGLNPNGLVPVIRDEGGILWESNTICRYLAAKAGREDLLPHEPRARAGVEQWMDWQATALNPAWTYAFRALSRRDAGFTDADQVEASRQAWNRQMGILEDQLAATGGFVAGDRFTLADIGIGLSVSRWLKTPIHRPDLPATAAYHQRLCARPGFIEQGRDGPA